MVGSVRLRTMSGRIRSYMIRAGRGSLVVSSISHWRICWSAGQSCDLPKVLEVGIDVDSHLGKGKRGTMTGSGGSQSSLFPQNSARDG